jgi:hypothetical protein
VKYEVSLQTCKDVQSGVHRMFMSVLLTELLWGFADVVENYRTSVGQFSYKNQKFNY